MIVWGFVIFALLVLYFMSYGAWWYLICRGFFPEQMSGPVNVCYLPVHWLLTCEPLLQSDLGQAYADYFSWCITLGYEHRYR